MTDLNTFLTPFLFGVTPIECMSSEECTQYIEAGYKHIVRKHTIHIPITNGLSIVNRPPYAFEFNLDHNGHIYTNFQCNLPFLLELGGQPVGQLKRLPICLLRWQNATVVIDLAESNRFDDIPINVVKIINVMHRCPLL